MLFSKRSLEGYLALDYRGAEAGSPDPNIPVCRGQMQELPTITCSHCQRVVIINHLRTRDRAYCPKCDHYICDGCDTVRVASGGACKTWKQIMDEHDAAVIKKEQKIII